LQRLAIMEIMDAVCLPLTYGDVAKQKAARNFVGDDSQAIEAIGHHITTIICSY
jgi:hypothetical protein